MQAGQTLAKHWANVVKEKWGKGEEALAGAEEHLPAPGRYVVGEGERKNRPDLLPLMIKTGHEIVRGGDNSSTDDDKVWSHKGVIAEFGVMVYGEGRQ